MVESCSISDYGVSMCKEALTTKKNYLSHRLVQKSPLFSALSDELLQEMMGYFRVERWGKKTYIDQVTLQSRFFLLLEGRIEMMRTNPDTGRSITVDLLYPGDSFDVITLLDGQIHEMFFSPVDELKVISVPIEKMRQWIWVYPELNQQFMPYLAQKMRDQENKTTDLALYDTTTRLSRIILQNLNKIKFYAGGKQDAHKQHLISGLSDERLARLIGSVRQVINQQLQHWKKQGVIDKKRNQIMINDLETIIDNADYARSMFKNV